MEKQWPSDKEAAHWTDEAELNRVKRSRALDQYLPLSEGRFGDNLFRQRRTDGTARVDEFVLRDAPPEQPALRGQPIFR